MGTVTWNEKTSFYKDGKDIVLRTYSIYVSGEKAAQSWFSTTYVVAAFFRCYATSLNDWPNIAEINLLPKVVLVQF